MLGSLCKVGYRASGKSGGSRNIQSAKDVLLSGFIGAEGKHVRRHGMLPQLVAVGGNVSVRDSRGFTPLHSAARLGSLPSGKPHPTAMPD